jgi:REP element-mobilizing transposase RayT
MLVFKMAKQLGLDLRPKRPPTWGGARDGAGRPKVKGGRRKVAHRTRGELGRKTPVHVTLRVVSEKAGLRKRTVYRLLRRSMRRSGHGEYFRICHYSIQGNHLHLICEAADRDALARGVQGFASSMARRLNRERDTRGRVFSERYHAHVLRSPTEVRNALCYVLNNWRRHRVHLERPGWRVDPFSSADLFDGWSGWHGARHADGVRPPPWLDPDEPVPTAEPRFWLLSDGWRRLGPLSIAAVPGPRFR